MALAGGEEMMLCAITSNGDLKGRRGKRFPLSHKAPHFSFVLTFFLGI